MYSDSEATFGAISICIGCCVKNVMFSSAEIMPGEEGGHDMLNLDIVGEDGLDPGDFFGTLTRCQDLGEGLRTLLNPRSLHIFDMNDHLTSS